MTAVLQVRRVAAGYQGAPVIRDIDLDVHPGEVVALLGPNGAGKTTLLSTIAGLIRPSSGQVCLAGRTVSKEPAHRVARRGLAFVPESRALFASLSARDNLLLARRRAGLDLNALFDMMPELRKCMPRRASVLSGGEQQMLALGRAVLTQPKVLLADEVSLGLAPVVVQRLLPVLRNLARDHGLGVLFVEQHVNMALNIADRAYVMQHGRIAISAPAAELRADPQRIRDSYLAVASPGAQPTPSAEPDHRIPGGSNGSGR